MLTIIDIIENFVEEYSKEKNVLEKYNLLTKFINEMRDYMHSLRMRTAPEEFNPEELKNIIAINLRSLPNSIQSALNSYFYLLLDFTHLKLQLDKYHHYLCECADLSVIRNAINEADLTIKQYTSEEPLSEEIITTGVTTSIIDKVISKMPNERRRLTELNAESPEKMIEGLAEKLDSYTSYDLKRCIKLLIQIRITQCKVNIANINLIKAIELGLQNKTL